MALQSEGKSAVGSLSIWGSIVAFGGGLLEVVSDPSVLPFVPHNWNPYIIMVGALVAAVGRATAKQKITSVVPK